MPAAIQVTVYTLNCINDVTEGSGRVRFGLGCLKLESLMLRDMPWRRITVARGPAAAPKGLAAAPSAARCWWWWWWWWWCGCRWAAMTLSSLADIRPTTCCLASGRFSNGSWLQLPRPLVEHGGDRCVWQQSTHTHVRDTTMKHTGVSWVGGWAGELQGRTCFCSSS